MTKKLDLTRWVVVTANHGEKFVGQVPEDVKSPSEYFQEKVAARQPVVLHGARLMLAQYGAAPGGMGNGIQTMVAFLPVDLADGPLEEIHLYPSSWYFPPSVESIIEKFERLLAAAEAAELNNSRRLSATRANIILPGA